MVQMSMIFRQPAWPDLTRQAAEGKVVSVQLPIEVAGLPDGIVSGKPSVAFRLDLPDGRIIIAETTLALFLTVADAMKAKYGDPRQ